MSTRDLFIGIDGGGTSTVAIATDSGGRILARVDGGPGIVRPEAPLAGVPDLAELTRRAAASAGNGPIRGLCCGLAGAGRPRERQRVGEALTATGIAQRVEIVSDAEAAFADAFGEGSGILLIAGTGSMALGRTGDGRVARAGGWGAVLGDEGSGWAIALAGLRAVARAADGRGPHTSLEESLVRAARCRVPEDLIGFAGGAPKAEIARLAEAVIRDANAGDPIADAIVQDAATSLAALVASVVRKLDPWPEPPPVAFTGGLVSPGRPLRERTQVAVMSVLQIMHIVERLIDAAAGAAALARARQQTRSSP